MIFEHVIFHKDNLKLDGTSIKRKAVRAVILKDKMLFMVYLNATNEYKFPGGGVNIDETIEEALIREVKEETGASVKRIGNRIGQITEYNREENDYIDYFKMVSDYYEVEIEEEVGEQKLDPYEKELEFEPRWISIEEALKVNVDNIDDDTKKKTKWIERETYVLSELNKYYK